MLLCMQKRIQAIYGDFGALVDYKKNAASDYALPTNEHYLPLLYALGASENEKAQFFNEKIVLGSISMRCVAYGMKN